MTSIVEGLLAVLKDLQWLIVIDTLLVFLVNYLMFNAAGRVKVSWRLLLVGGLISVVLTPITNVLICRGLSQYLTASMPGERLTSSCGDSRFLSSLCF